MADPIGLAVGAAVAALAGLAGLGLYQKSKSGSPGPPPGSPPAQPPGPAPPLGPGVYPANTPGAFPVQLIVVNSEDAGRICAVPGGCQTGDGTTVIWYGPGTQVDFTASVPGFGPFTGFDHFDGPGITTKENPFVATIQDAGFVKAVYAFLGVAPA